MWKVLDLLLASFQTTMTWKIGDVAVHWDGKHLIRLEDVRTAYASLRDVDAEIIVGILNADHDRIIVKNPGNMLQRMQDVGYVDNCTTINVPSGELTHVTICGHMYKMYTGDSEYGILEDKWDFYHVLRNKQEVKFVTTFGFEVFNGEIIRSVRAGDFTDFHYMNGIEY